MPEHSSGKEGDGPPNPIEKQNPTSTVKPDQKTLTFAEALGGASGGSQSLRKYAEIIALQKKERNVLELKLRKIKPININNQEAENVPNLTFDDLSELIFEVFNIKFEHCIGVDYNTGKYDTKEIHLKAEVDSSNYITSQPIMYKSHEITVKKMLHNVTKVTFKNVPMYVPDEELLHLCGIYGSVVENKVHWEQHRITTSTKKGVLISPTRFVLMHLNNGASFNNFYWLEGPMPGDPGRRITVIHTGQKQQCSHCLLTASTGCKGAGNGRVCAKTDMEKAKMSQYMQALKATTGYESLKTKYMRQLAKSFPNRQGEPEFDTTQIIDMDRDIDLDSEETEVTLPILPINPIVEKDLEIATLNKTVEGLKEQVLAMDDLRNELEEAKAENKRVLNISKQVGRRLSVSRKANEQKMISLVKTGKNWTEDSAHLACSHAATMNDDEFEIDEKTDEVIPKNKNKDFMKKVHDCLDKEDKLQYERYLEMKRMIMDLMKKTIKKKSEVRGEKRENEHSGEDSSLQSKPRVTSPPKC